jgi:hypothetical protein
MFWSWYISLAKLNWLPDLFHEDGFLHFVGLLGVLCLTAAANCPVFDGVCGIEALNLLATLSNSFNGATTVTIYLYIANLHHPDT